MTDERYKKLMADVGMPNSISLLQALKQCAMEATLAERERAVKAVGNVNDWIWEESKATGSGRETYIKMSDAIKVIRKLAVNDNSGE
jgi:hypothetical protein